MKKFEAGTSADSDDIGPSLMTERDPYTVFLAVSESDPINVIFVFSHNEDDSQTFHVTYELEEAEHLHKRLGEIITKIKLGMKPEDISKSFAAS